MMAPFTDQGSIIMTTPQILFGLITAISASLLGMALAPLDPAGWHLLAVGATIGILTLASPLLQTRLQPATVRANASIQSAARHGH
jgi:hypothetical protein